MFGFIYLAGVLGERVHYDIRRKLFNHLQELSFSYFDRTPVGWIMSRVTSDAGRIAELVTWGMVDVTWAILNVGTALVFMAADQLEAGPGGAGHRAGDGGHRCLVQDAHPGRSSARCAS